MKTDTVLAKLQPWFHHYIDSFPDPDADVRRNFELKRTHTARVGEEIRFLAQRLRLDAAETALAEICALLHDIGRFEQYYRFRTFMDPVSTDHAALGLEVIDRHDLLWGLNEADRSLVREAIANHNRRDIDSGLERRTRFFSRLIRDADKLDIWKLVIAYYNEEVKNDAVRIGLSLDNTVTAKVFDDLMAGRIAGKEDFRTLNDFKLNQIAWVYDLNFNCSLERVRERRYLQDIFRHLDGGLPGVTGFYCRALSFLYGNSTFA
ncbi:MAG: HD domain-containing protein [Victivallales bacterium]|nr:HD domain-containing protein [Victivallales bacterium]